MIRPCTVCCTKGVIDGATFVEHNKRMCCQCLCEAWLINISSLFSVKVSSNPWLFFTLIVFICISIVCHCMSEVVFFSCMMTDCPFYRLIDTIYVQTNTLTERRRKKTRSLYVMYLQLGALTPIFLRLQKVYLLSTILW